MTTCATCRCQSPCCLLVFESSWKQCACHFRLSLGLAPLLLARTSQAFLLRCLFTRVLLCSVIVLGPHMCPGVFHTDLADAPVPTSLTPVTSSRATKLSFDLINRISSSHCCLWVLMNRINAFVQSSKHLDCLCRAAVTDEM